MLPSYNKKSFTLFPPVGCTGAVLAAFEKLFVGDDEDKRASVSASATDVEFFALFSASDIPCLACETAGLTPKCGSLATTPTQHYQVPHPMEMKKRLTLEENEVFADSCIRHNKCAHATVHALLGVDRNGAGKRR